MKRQIKNLIYIAGFPLFSLVSRRVAPSVFYRRDGRWRARIHGTSFPVPRPRLESLEYFRHFVPRPGGLVLDVGGELGLETGQFSEIVGNQGRVVVFECLPRHAENLRNLARGWGNVSVVEAACWNRAETLEFFVGRTPGSNTAVPDARGQRGQLLADREVERIQVRAETLDRMWAEYAGSAPVDFLKMDIEGAEYEAIEGASQLLRQTRAIVVAAYHIRDGVRTSPRVKSMLQSLGFTVRVDENHHVYGIRP